MVVEAAPTPPPEERVGLSVNLTVGYPERLSRWRLFLKWLFVFPLYFWVWAYGFLSLVLVFVAFWAILFTGVYPRGLFDLVKGYLAASARVSAYFPLLISDRWRTTEPSPIQIEAEPPERLSRKMLLLKVPLYLVQSVASVANVAILLGAFVAIPCWFAILITGRCPPSLFSAQTKLLQWNVRLHAWQLFMSDDWRLWGETRKVRVLTVLGVVLYTVVNPILLVSSLAGGGFADRLADIAGVDDAQAVVEQFMAAGEQNDVNLAMELSTSDISRAAITSLFGNRSVFEGFRDTEVDRWRRSATGEESRMDLWGRIRYRDGSEREFNAVLLEVDGQWKIAGFHASSTRR
jgi:hypothetical protein